MRALYFDCSAGMRALYEAAPGMADILPSLDFHIGDPDPADLPADSPFRSLDNVTLTPHAAWVSPEAAERLLRMRIERLRDALAA